MAFFKTDLPKLLTKKELKAQKQAQQETLTADTQTSLQEAPIIEHPDGLICFLKSNQKRQILGLAALEIIQLSFNLLEKVQGVSRDGKTGIPLQLYPYFEEHKTQIGFRFVGDEELLNKTTKLLQKMQGHLELLKKGTARQHHIPASWAAVYRQFFKRLKQYKQQLEFVDSASQGCLFSVHFDEVEDLIQALDQLKSAPQKVKITGEITGFSQNNHQIEFKVEAKDWNGIRTKKSVARPIKCRANKKMLAFAKKYMDQEIELEALMEIDESGNKSYQLRMILLKTSAGLIKEKIIYEGPKGGQFYLSYMGKRVYLSKAKKRS